MTALLYSPTAMPVLDFGLPARRPTAATLSVETELHHHQLGFQVGRHKDCDERVGALGALPKRHPPLRPRRVSMYPPSLPIVPCVYLMLVGLETKHLATI
jgi:hypothetical protein